jgi:hypothetical protein
MGPRGLRDGGGEVISLTRRPAVLYSQEDSWYSVLPQSHTATERFRRIVKSNNLSGNRNCGHSVCDVVPQPFTLSRPLPLPPGPSRIKQISHKTNKLFNIHDMGMTAVWLKHSCVDIMSDKEQVTLLIFSESCKLWESWFAWKLMEYSSHCWQFSQTNYGKGICVRFIGAMCFDLPSLWLNTEFHLHQMFQFLKPLRNDPVLLIVGSCYTYA